MSSNKYVVLNGHHEDAEQAILACGSALCEIGAVGPNFGAKCVERERIYPTGLPTEIPVAIPHCFDESVTMNAICVMRLDEPVKFRRMDDDEETVMCSLVFNLAVMKPDEHLEALQNLMAVLADEQTIRQIQGLSEQDLIPYLEEHIG